MPVRQFDPTTGQAFQGDIAIVPMPATIAIAKNDEIRPREGRLIIQEGEVSGHHHGIVLPAHRNFRQGSTAPAALTARDRKLLRTFGGASKQTSARLFRDPAAVEALRGAGILTRTDLAIGCLVVEGAGVVVTHDEHDGIMLPPGNYYLGRQVESAGAEERVVTD